MEKASLFEHNEQAYIRLCEALKDSKCTTINHATGTGKSFIALKYLYENRDKKYLYIAPTYPIIEQLLKSCYKIGLTPDDINIDTMIYRTLLQMDMDELYQKYDGIIFDEYHRTGAKETYKKIKQLKLNLQQGNDSKKFIGLTATPVRYLDKGRNMTQEIFDGNVASSLYLSEAMLKELLPVPIYINSKIACRDEYYRISRKVSKLAPTKEKQELEKRIENIGKKIDNGAADNREMIGQYIKDKKGKYIVFCNTIDALESYYQEIDGWFAGLGKIKKYKVYSGQQDLEKRTRGEKQRTSHEVNQANLEGFNEDKDGISVLLCVDILNEGVHVDDIDGVILLRRTTSPIIYFQQIGRALSFSGRHKQIKIFDLVNNFGNHNAIDAVYQEFLEEIKRQIELHPEKAKQYQTILDKFKIMDETREILSELNEIGSQVTPEKIIASKINYSIGLLQEQGEKDKELLRLFSDEDVKKAYMTISKYYKYVDNEQFKRLLELDIMLPEELSMSYEERIEQLEGLNSIIEYEKGKHDLWINRYIDFINQNGQRPSLNSDNHNEHILVQRYLNCVPYLSEQLKEKLRKTINSNQLDYQAWEKVLLGDKVYGGDIENIIATASKYIEEGHVLPEYLQHAMTNITLSYNIKQNTQLFELLEKSDIIEQEKRKQSAIDRLNRLSEIMRVLEEIAELSKEELEKTGITKQIKELSPADRTYIKRRYSVLKKQQYRRLIRGTEGSDLLSFCKKMRTIKGDEILEDFSNIEQDKEMYATLKGIIEFMAENGGKVPSKDSDMELERELAIQLEKYMQNGSILSDFSNIEEDMQIQWCSPEQIMYSIIVERFRESDIKLAILKNVEFFSKHGRRALKNSQDEEERAIAIDYERKCISNMGQDREMISILNKLFNSKKNLQRTCDAYIKNIKAIQGER